MTLKNRMDLATLLHAHGVRMMNKFDGTELVQTPIQKGESFTYELNFPDAGIYWYHPHVRSDYVQDMGLYGALLVIPQDPKYYNPVHREMVLLLDDVQTGDQMIPYYHEFANYTFGGRYGNTMLVNGDPNLKLDFNKGEIVRFFLVNTANTRIFVLTIPGIVFKLIGSDIGKYEREEWMEQIVISPSERFIVEALFDQPGKLILTHQSLRQNYNLASLTVSNEKVEPSISGQFTQLHENKTEIEEINTLRAELDKAINFSISLSYRWINNNATNENNTFSNMMDSSGFSSTQTPFGMGNIMMNDTNSSNINTNNLTSAMDFSGINMSGMALENINSMDQFLTSETILWQMTYLNTKQVNDKVHWQLKRGSLVKIQISNTGDGAFSMQHPIHFHGQRFLIAKINGVKNENLVWKDTVLIKDKDTVEILLDASNPGLWMAHCHIAEHLTGQMAIAFEVI